MIGFRYVRSLRSDWRFHHGALIPLTMSHAIEPLTLWQGIQLVSRHIAAFVRWEEDFDQVGTSEWWHIIKDGSEEFTKLSSNTRSKVRRGAKRFIASPESRDVISSEGYDVYVSAFSRYETFENIISAHEFAKAVESLPPETEFWTVRDVESRRVVAFSENIVRDGACFYDTVWFDPSALKAYVGYVLFHKMNKHYLNERSMRYVSDGARNISHDTNIHEFLQQKFGFRRAYARLRVVYFPGLGLAVSFLYPFRRWFAKRPGGFFQRLSVLLKQERIRRSCAKLKSSTP